MAVAASAAPADVGSDWNGAETFNMTLSSMMLDRERSCEEGSKQPEARRRVPVAPFRLYWRALLRCRRVNHEVRRGYRVHSRTDCEIFARNEGSRESHRRRRSR